MQRFFVVAFLCCLIGARVSSPALAQEAVQDQITVERILVDARVTDYSGDPILNLKPEDFDVRIDGKRAVVESVLWVPETTAARVMAGLNEDENVAVMPASEDEPAPKGRLFVYFVQTDFSREPVRIGGAIKFLANADEMIENLEPGDRVAVVSFDSHMKFWMDFTENPSDISYAIRQAQTTAEPPTPRVVPNPSLARRLNAEEMKKATSSDEAFIILANALRPIPGPKSMILFGWGLGSRSGMHEKYAIARYALETARVTIFALDMTQADYHDLEIGLGKAAKDTGGFYAKTHIFPKLAVDRLQRTLAGHYELEVRKPETKVRGTHTIDVRVKKRGSHVMARQTYVDD